MDQSIQQPNIKFSHGGRRPGAGRKLGSGQIVPTSLRRELRDIAKDYTIEAINAAVAIMRKAKARDSDRLKAVEILLDRAHGRPLQIAEVTGKDGGAIEVTVSERRERARAVLEAAFGEGAWSVPPGVGRA